MKVRFNLKSKKETETYILLVFRYDEQLLRWHPNDRVAVKDWNVADGRVKRGVRGAAHLNEALDKLEGFVLDTYRQYRNAGNTLSPERFRELLDEFWKGRTRAAAEKEAVPSLAQYILVAKADKLRTRTISADRAKHYDVVAGKVKKMDAKRKKPYQLDDLGLEFLEDFVEFDIADGAGSPNTIRNHIAVLKSAMTAALDKGVTENRAHESKRFAYEAYESDQIALTESEVAALAELDLSAQKTYDLVRDLFVIGCYTGLRYGDYATLSSANIRTVEGVPMLIKRAEKTGKNAAIPLSGAALRIVEKYGGALPKGITNQKTNAYLKEIARMAGITTVIEVERYERGFLVRKKTAKCNEVVTHTARRTFATIEYVKAVREGRPIEPIMAITGHSKLSLFLHYVKATAEVQAIAFVKSKKVAG